MKGLKRKLPVGVLIAAGIGFLLWKVFAPSSPSQALSYKYEVIRRGDLTVKVSTVGNIALSKKEILSFGTSGYVKEIKVEVGDRVKKGDILASLYTGDIERSLLQAERELRLAEIKLEKLLEGASEGEIAMARARVNYLEAKAKNLEEEVSELEARSLVDPLLLDMKRAELEMARAELLQAKEELEELLEGADPKDIEMRRIEVEMAKARVEEYREKLEGCFIKAPFDGLISEIAIEEGVGVKERTKAMVIADPTKVEAHATVDEIDVVKLKVGQRARITFDMMPDLKLTGYIKRISPKAKIQAGVVSFEVVFGIDGWDERLREGLSCVIDVLVEERKGVILVPNTALRTKGGKTYVIVLDGETPRPKPVKIGLRGEKYSEVIWGLEEGERVITGIKEEKKPKIRMRLR